MPLCNNALFFFVTFPTTFSVQNLQGIELRIKRVFFFPLISNFGQGSIVSSFSGKEGKMGGCGDGGGWINKVRETCGEVTAGFGFYR